ncbi:MAG: hypothetical protein D5S00_05575 [Tindallia sp. MSAO_Bac2]|nr:MAG: hypothetical protein D5S00_05575 [Tindallia sp. MSAO_Bac2]
MIDGVLKEEEAIKNRAEEIDFRVGISDVPDNIARKRIDEISHVIKIDLEDPINRLKLETLLKLL